MNKPETSRRDFISKILGKIPLFKVYLQKQDLRTADFVARSLCVNLLEELHENLQTRIAEIEVSKVSEWQTVNLALERLTSDIRYANQGYSGLFAHIKKGQPDLLERMRDLDVELFDLLADLRLERPHLPAGWQQHLDKIRDQWQRRQHCLLTASPQ